MMTPWIFGLSFKSLDPIYWVGVDVLFTEVEIKNNFLPIRSLVYLHYLIGLVWSEWYQFGSLA